MKEQHPIAMRGMAWLSRVPPPLVGCWYVEHHWDGESRCRTPCGKLIYQAKTYEGKLGELWAAERMGTIMTGATEAVMRNPRFPLTEVTLVLAVPSYPPKRPFNLPDVLADYVARTLGAERSVDGLLKVATTPPAKTTPEEEVLRAAADAYVVATDVLGETVLLVDDLVHSGATLAGIARHLVEEGAAVVGGLAATRAYKGLR